MTADTPVPMNARARLSRGGRIALLASLALNVLFLGGFVSALVRHGGGQPMRNGNGNNGLGAYVQTLPADRSREISRRLNDKRQALGGLRREARTARDEAFATLSADPFDQERFVAAQKRLIEVEHRQRLGQLEILADIASAMTADERRAFLNWRKDAQQPAASVVTTPPPKP